MTMALTDQQRQIIVDLCNAYEIPMAKRAPFEAEVVKVLKQRSQQTWDDEQQVVRAFSDVILTGGPSSTFEVQAQ